MTRSLPLRPDLLRRSRGDDLIQRIHASEDELCGALEHICTRRRAELERLALPIPELDESIGGGRILCTDFNTDQCGYATLVSNGYFDVDDIPGWDTWFHHRSTGELVGELFCWVPPQLIDLADAGIEGIPVRSAWWVESFPKGVV